MPTPVPPTRRLCLAAAAAAAWPARAGAGRVVRFVRPDNRRPVEQWFPYQLLLAVLEASGGRFQVDATRTMTQARAERELSDPRGVIDVYVMGHSPARERQLQLIPQPLFRGLFGWRLLMVRPETAASWAGPATLDGLRTLRLIQGDDWPDATILRHNGLRVLGGPSQLHRLHEALKAGHADALPLAVPEAWRERDADPERLAVLPGVALHYRFDLFFFTRQGDRQLSDALQRGLAVLQRNGRHEALLRQRLGDALERSALAGRQVIELDNPLLSPPLRALPAAHWRL